jgi:hypothetical protein
MESSHGIEGGKPKKLSLKFKLYCYLCYDIGNLLLSAINILQGAPPERTLFILVGNVVVMNFVFWYLFRASDRSAHNA